MKALTIEEIVKIAQNKEPIYMVALVDDTNGLFPIKAYYFPVVVYENNSDEVACFQMFNRLVNGLVYLIEDYGKTWLAYRNKEQAECKGELVELICKLDDTIYVPWIFDGVSSIAELQVVFIEINKLHNNYVTNLGETIDMDNFKEFRYYQRMHHGVYSEQDFNKVWFKDKKLAEQKLEELKKIGAL